MNRFLLTGLMITAATTCMAQTEDDVKGRSPLPKGVMGEAGFFVEEFVPNRLKVETSAPAVRFSTTSPLTVQVKAEEMFGQPAANRPVSAVVTYSAADFAPKGWEQYTFGDSEVKFLKRDAELGDVEVDGEGRTDIAVPFPESPAPAAIRAVVQATVKDQGRGVTSRLERMLDPVPYYLGLRAAADTFLRPQHESSFEVVAVSPVGETAVADSHLTGSISRVLWNSILEESDDDVYNFKTSRQLEPVQQVDLALQGGKAQIAWTPPAAGQYMLRVFDTGSSASTSLQFYVSDSAMADQPWSLEKPERVELVLDKKQYRAGEPARVLVKAPFAGTLLLSVEQDRVLTSSVHRMSANTIEVPVPIDATMAPNIYITASVIRPVKPADKWLPHRAIGMATAKVVPDDRRLEPVIAAPAEVRPNSPLAVSVALQDLATSQPVAGDLFVWAVDEGVLSLTDYKTPDPFLFFTEPRRLMVETADFFSRLMPDLLNRAITPSGTGGGDEAGGSSRLSPVASERVKPVVLWSGLVKTDAQGSATVSWIVPQYMGRLRVMAVAAAGPKFGTASKEVFVRSPLMIKEGVPRFLAPGDSAEVALTIYNNSAAEITPSLTVTTTGAVTIGKVPTSPAIPAGGQRTVTALMAAGAESVGQGVIEFSAAAGAESYGSSITLPVRPPAAFTRVSSIEVIKAGERRQVAIPGADMLPGTTTATLTVSGSPMLELAGALDFNLQYPYGCAEQIISGLFPLLTMTDLAREIAPGRFNGDGLKQSVQRGIDRLLMHQTSSGGLSTWPGQTEPWAWGSVYGLHFLTEASRNGYQVPDEALKSLVDYCQTVLDSDPEEPIANALTERAYVAYAMGSAGRRMMGGMEKLYGRRAEMDASGRALLAAAYKGQGLEAQAKELLSGIRDAGAAPGATLPILGSPTREKALVLAAYLDIEPGSTEAPLIAQAISRERNNGHWGTTQNNAFALWALGRFARETSSTIAGHGTVTELPGGVDRDFSTSNPLHIGDAKLAGSTVMVEGLEGTSYAYLTVGGVPRKANAQPVSQGLAVERKFLRRDGSEVDLGKVKQGELLIAEISIGGNRDLTNVVIQDLLPAGLEPENSRLATAETSRDTEEDGEGQEDGEENGLSAERIDTRDDRVIAFVSLAKTDSGRQVYRHVVRAVTPGTYVVPAVQVEAMYDPSVVARSAAGTVTVVK